MGWDFPRTSQPGWYRVHTRSGFKERENGVRARHFLDGVPDGGLDQLTSSQGGAHSPPSAAIPNASLTLIAGAYQPLRPRTPKASGHALRGRKRSCWFLSPAVKDLIILLPI